MTFSKDMQTSSRPSLHRPAVVHSRNNSHSIIGSSLNSHHRVTRRKSMSGTAANRAAVAAILGETAESTKCVPIITNSRRSTVSRPVPRQATVTTPIAGSMPTFRTSDAPGSPGAHIKIEGQDYGMDGGPFTGVPLEEGGIRYQDQESHGLHHDSRARRTSEGQSLPAKEAPKSSRAELRCDKCGKGYKHSSCLTKHLWEHTPGWSVTSKLLISKHQQVQLLEAASVLVSMNISKDANTPPDSAKDFHSEAGSYSPTASGYSDQRDRLSSADTTPPPQADVFASGGYSGTGLVPVGYGRGYGFARSYQSIPSPNSLFANSVPNGAGFGHTRQDNHDNRPLSSGRNHTGADDRDLAAAVELLSCSHGSTAGGQYAATLPSNAPPVPPLPVQYLDDAAKSWGGHGLFASLPGRQPESFARGEARTSPPKVEEAYSIMDEDDDYDDSRSRARSDEDDDGVFGRMEE